MRRTQLTSVNFEDEEAGVWPKEQAYPLDAGKDEETNPTQIPQTGSSPGNTLI